MIGRKIVLESSSWVFGLAMAGITGCTENEPCDPGRILRIDECIVAPASSGSSDAGRDGAASDGAPASLFGKACSSQSDCSGDAPICAAPQLPYCTQIDCLAGGKNAGACPSGYQCLGTGSQSACVKQ